MTKVLKVKAISPSFQQALIAGGLAKKARNSYNAAFPVEEPNLTQQFMAKTEATRRMETNPSSDPVERMERLVHEFATHTEELINADGFEKIFYPRLGRDKKSLSPQEYTKSIIPGIRSFLQDIALSAQNGQNSEAYSKAYADLKEYFWMFHPNPNLRTKE